MKKSDYLLTILNIVTEFIILYFLYILFAFDNVSILRYSFMYFMLGIIFNRFSTKTNLVWQQAKLIFLSNISFFLATNVMNSLRVWTLRYALSNLCVTVIMSFMALLTNRFYRITFRNIFAKNILIIGVNSDTLQLLETYSRNRFSISKVKAIVKTKFDDTALYKDIKFDIVDNYNLGKIVKEYNINEIVISVNDDFNDEINNYLNEIDLKNIVVKSIVKSYGLVTYQSLIEDFDGMLLLTTSSGQQVFKLFIKRIIDIMAGICGIILLIPLSIFVKISYVLAKDYDPIFFVQERIGKDGQIFKIFKYRTMIVGAEEVLEQLMKDNPAIREEYLINKKIIDDPRVTKIGSFLRHTSLDEFPQFINVLIGNMSLIGPRPYLPREIEDMGSSYEKIITCKPGITGMWQTHGRSDVNFNDRCNMDVYYAMNWSIWLDFMILFKTGQVVKNGDGAL